MIWWLIGYLAVGIGVPLWIMATHPDELNKILSRVPKEYRPLVLILSITVSAIFWPALLIESITRGHS